MMNQETQILDVAASKLEWSKVLGKLSEFASSEVGIEAARKLAFHESADAARKALQQTSEARRLIIEGDEPALLDIVDLKAELTRAAMQAVLSPEELLRVAAVLTASRKTRLILMSRWEDYPVLAQPTARMHEDEGLERSIKSAIDPDGAVNDSASPKLADLRRRYKKAHTRIYETMKTMTGKPELAEYLQDDFFTMRNGRYVLLVRIEKQSKVDGIVHDISGTSQSLYIEPKEITQLNNVLRATELEIDREIHRILAGFSLRVTKIGPALRRTVAALVEVDLALARARYADFLDAHEPEINETGAMLLKDLRHPLLAEQDIDVIPNTVQIDPEVSCLLITGPNAGGKTVLLKSVGLCALMARAGLHPPVGPDSVVAFFHRIFAEIGDAQSIELGLSSFAARIAALKRIMENLDGRCLVLLDEIGSGTDPRQGIALSTAFLERMSAMKARTLVTTHFSELAAMAANREGFLNASMEFDREKMLPTYRLRVGIAGRSGAFDVAMRMGLDSSIIERARELYEGVGSELDEVMDRLDQTHQELSARLREAQEAKREAQALVEKQRDIVRDLERRKERVAQKEMVKVQAEYHAARQEIQTAVASVKLRPSKKKSIVTRETIARVVEDVKSTTPEPEKKKTGPPLAPIRDWSRMKKGASVYISSMKSDAALETGPNDKRQVIVIVGGMRITMDSADVFVRRDRPAKKFAAKIEFQESHEASESTGLSARTLDLRGQRADDALDRVRDFLDMTFRKRWEKIFIIHGHGTGVLKKEVRKQLAETHWKISFRPGERGEGGDGATVVEMNFDSDN
jgi:DNA mismatch repair protein MutS2